MLSDFTRDFPSDSGLHPRCHIAFSDHYSGLLYSVRVPQPVFDLLHVDIFEKHRAVTLRKVPQFGPVCCSLVTRCRRCPVGRNDPYICAVTFPEQHIRRDMIAGHISLMLSDIYNISHHETDFLNFIF